MPLPPQYQTVMPYLIVEGAEKFIVFTQNTFGAVEQLRVPRAPGVIMHAEINLGGSTIMLADATETYPRRLAGLFVSVKNADETYARALREGATPVTPLADQPYGRSGGVLDPFGNTWWITSVK